MNSSSSAVLRKRSIIPRKTLKLRYSNETDWKKRSKAAILLYGEYWQRARGLNGNILPLAGRRFPACLRIPARTVYSGQEKYEMRPRETRNGNAGDVFRFPNIRANSPYTLFCPILSTLGAHLAIVRLQKKIIFHADYSVMQLAKNDNMMARLRLYNFLFLYYFKNILEW